MKLFLKRDLDGSVLPVVSYGHLALSSNDEFL